MSIGIPAVNSANKYGMKNAPPPFSYATAGNRQIFPKPIADPTAAKIKPALVPHSERAFIFVPSFFTTIMSASIRRIFFQYSNIFIRIPPPFL